MYIGGVQPLEKIVIQEKASKMRLEVESRNRRLLCSSPNPSALGLTQATYLGRTQSRFLTDFKHLELRQTYQQ